MKRLSTFFTLLLSVTICAFGEVTGAKSTSIYSVCEFGAKGDGKTINTNFIQTAIDTANKNGGGVVLFPAGQYVTGTIILKDYVTLRFDNGSTLLGSIDLTDYPANLGLVYLAKPYVWRAPLIYAEGVRYIGIEGTGIIDGRGSRKNFQPLPRELQRPGLIRFTDCRFINIKDVTLRNSACWTLHLRHCEDATIRNIVLNSNVNRNNDGIDIDGCRRLNITACNINTEDDAIVLKSFMRETVSDIVIANCVLSSSCSAIKIGTETVGDFKNISIANCAIYGSRGINLYSVDGANINNVTINNISMRNCKSVIQLRLGDRLRPYAMPENQHITTPGSLKNIMISHVQAIGVEDSQDFICGIPEHPLENIELSDFHISYYGNGTVAQAIREIPEQTRTYPKIGMFGDLPTYGFYIRHAKGVRLNNIRLDYLNPDMRPAIMFDDVNGIHVNDCTLKGSESDLPLISLNNVEDAVIRNSRFLEKCNTFVGVSGKSSQNIVLQGNILHNVKKTIQRDKGVKNNAVFETGTIL